MHPADGRQPGTPRDAEPALTSRDSRLCVRAAAALGLSLLGVSIYRAATQSLTHDEALTFQWYVAGPLTGLFTRLEANNHVFHTLLAWCSVRSFGLSELTLRLPALLGGALYLGAAFGLCRQLLGRRALFLLGYCLLAFNPLVLDFLSAARGYGLALGLMLASAWLLLPELIAAAPPTAANGNAPPTGRAAPRRAGRLVAASLAAGLSVAANLTLAPACTALVLVALALLLAAPGRRDRASRALPLLLPGFVAAAALLAWPMLHARSGSFFVGLPSFTETSFDLVNRSLAHHDVAWPLDTRGMAYRVERLAFALVGVPLLLALLALRAGWLARHFSACSREQRGLVVVAGTLLLSVLLLGGLHVVAGLPWPVDRTGLALIVLGTLGAVALLRDALQGGLGSRLARPAGLALGALLAFVALQFAAQLQVTRYALWPEDAGTRELFEQIEAHEQSVARPGGEEADARPVRVAVVSWAHEPALNFYRFLHHARWMASVERTWPVPAGSWDYLVSPPPLPDSVAGARVIYTEPLTGTLLAVPRGAR